MRYRRTQGRTCRPWRTTRPKKTTHGTSRRQTLTHTLIKAHLNLRQPTSQLRQGLTLTFPKNLKLNEINSTRTLSGTAAVDFTNGSIQPLISDSGEDMYVDVEEPFTAVMVYASNSGSAATGRHAYIKIDGEEVATSAESIPAAGAEIKYTHSRTGKVKVGFGATN